MDYRKESLQLHKKLKGKIEIKSKLSEIKNRDDLSIAYTPGVGAVSNFIKLNPDQVEDYTIKGNSIAVVSDGSAVLGLGNIGPLGALPVMEGKALIFKELADVDAFPIVLKTQDTEEIIQTIKNISPTFGGINLEDITSPRCFEIEKRLSQELNIPVFHDDQHGAAIVILVALINALKLANKKIGEIKIVINGAGAAGIATAKLFLEYGIENIIMADSKGTLHQNRNDLNESKIELAKITNLENIEGGLKEALREADVFVGLSAPKIFQPEFISLMASQPIIFAMANPTPEIMPNLAKENGAFIVGSGRSDFPNQINNMLVFPGLFRGLLDNKIKKITPAIKTAVIEALANYLPREELNINKILPDVLDKNVPQAIAKRISETKQK